MSLSLSHSQFLAHAHAHSSGRKLQKYVREALKAFRKFTHENRTWYTCNVERLKQCDRLGDKREISLWRTHFFLASPHFDDVHAVVFSQRPGTELAEITRKMQISGLYLAISPIEIVETSRGHRVHFDTPLVFASIDKAAVFAPPVQ